MDSSKKFIRFLILNVSAWSLCYHNTLVQYAIKPEDNVRILFATDNFPIKQWKSFYRFEFIMLKTTFKTEWITKLLT